MEYQTILYEVRNQIAFVTFNRPESMNAIDRETTRDLVEACRKLRRIAAFSGCDFHGRGRKSFFRRHGFKGTRGDCLFAD